MCVPKIRFCNIDDEDHRVAVALVFATLVVGIGFAARVTDGSGTANATVVKPAKPVTASAGEPRTIR